MPAFSVTTSTAVEIITDQMAHRIQSEEHDAIGVSIDVDDNSIRLIDGHNKDQARHGEPLDVGDVLDMDPNGLSWYAIGDSGTATVNVTLIKYKPLNRGRV